MAKIIPQVLQACLSLGLLLSILGPWADLRAQEKATLKEVRIQGNLRVEGDGIRLHVKVRPGDRFDPAQVDQDVKAIYRMGFFEDVKAEFSPDGVLTYAVIEKPYIRQVTIQGHANVAREKIETALGVSARTILDRDKVLAGVERVKKLYSEQGYVNARVDSKVEPADNNQAVVTVNIDEGSRLLIEKISFEGNRAFSNKTLNGLMATKERWFLSFLTSRGVLDQDALTNDLAILSAHYYDNGYVNHKIDEPVVLKRRDGIEVIIRIEEGEPYRVGSVEIGGELIDDPEKLLKKVQLTTGQIFRGSRLREDISALTEMYSNKGFAFAQVEPATKVDAKEKRVDIALMITRGPPVYLNRVLITGNTKSKDKIVRREIQTTEQELFRGGKLKKSRDALQRTGYFQDVQLTTQKTGQPDKVDLLVDVKEGPTGSFSIGAGYSSGDQFILSSSIGEKNLFGSGRSLSASVDLGTSRQDFSINFTDPYLFDRRFSLGIELFNTERKYADFTSRRTGFGMRAGYPLNKFAFPFFSAPSEDPSGETTSLVEYMRTGLVYELVRGKITEVDADATTAIRDEKGTSVTSSITPQLSYDSRDHFFSPTQGTQSNVSLEFAGLGGDNRFLKMDARGRWFYPLLKDPRWGGNYTLSLGGNLGYGLGLKERPNGEKNLPLFERYFPGGINSVRGFNERSLGPRQDGDTIGGDKQAIVNAEWLFPIYEQYGLRGVTFFDMGQAFKRSESINPGEFRRSVGAGARWLSPFGPLRVELGFPLNKKADDDTSVVGFSFGALP